MENLKQVLFQFLDLVIKFKNDIIQVLEKNDIDLSSRSIKTLAKDVEKLAFDPTLLSLSRDGSILYKNKPTGKFINTYSDKSIAMGNSSGMSWPEEFDRGKLTIAPDSGLLRYKGESISKYIGFNGNSSSPFSIEYSKSISVPKPFDESLIGIDSDGELRYSGTRTYRYVNINGTSLSIGSSTRLNFPQPFDKDKLTKIDSNDGQLYYEGEGWLSGKYVNINGKSIYLGTSSSINWPEAEDTNPWVSGSYSFNVAWGGDGLYFKGRNYGKGTKSFTVSAYGYANNGLDFEVS